MLARIDSTVRLQIFITSRPSGHVERLFNQERILRIEMHAGQQGSTKDIEAFIDRRLSAEARAARNPASGRAAMISEILAKSNGNFLWASLIMAQLEEVAGVEKMADAIDKVPPEMTGLYQGIIQAIEESPNADLAHCILKWVVCAPQPLTADELKEAVRLDINQTIQTPEKLPHICGNLITIDGTSRVQLMHQTVKSYLTGSERGEGSKDARREGGSPQASYVICPRTHSRLAAVCLNHLNSKNFNPPRSRKVLSPTNIGTVSAFDQYAATHFSYHLAHSDLSSDPTVDLLSRLATFASSNILTWVERLASSGRLTPLTQALQYLKTYLTRQLHTVSPLDSEYQLVDAFAGDLARLLTNFGRSLIDLPASVHFLIPPLCPTSTAIYQKYGKRTRQSVLCKSNETWDDRIFCQIFPSDPMAISCNHQYLAVGLADRTVQIYRSHTFEAVGTVEHGEPVHKLATTEVLPTLIASCSPRKLVLWDMSMGAGSASCRRWSKPLRSLTTTMSFSASAETLYVVGRDGKVLTFDVADGTLLDNTPLSAESSDSETEGPHSHGRGGRRARFLAAQVARISPVLDLVAVGYKSSHLFISHLSDGDRIGCFEKDGSEGLQVAQQILHIEFNPLEDLSLVAVAYQDGDLVTLDPFSLQQRDNVHHFTSALASSPDGRTLAAASNDSVITLFAFETLRPLCRIAALEMQLSALVFAPNGRRIVDIRARTCNAWEPAALVRKHLLDDSSSEADSETVGGGHDNSNTALLSSRELRYTRIFDTQRAITDVDQAGDSHYMFCGRHDGSISVYDTAKGRTVQELLFHGRGVSIRHLAWSAHAKILFSADGSRCVATRLLPPPVGGVTWQVGEEVFRRSLAASVTVTVTQILVSPDGLSALFAYNNGGVVLWDTRDGSIKTFASPLAATTEGSTEQTWWMPHPTDGSRLVQCTTGGSMHLFLWNNLERETPEGAGIPIRLPLGTRLSNQWYCRRGGQADVLLVQAYKPGGSSATKKRLLLAIDPSSIQASSLEVRVTTGSTPTPHESNNTGADGLEGDLEPGRLEDNIKVVVGIYRSSLYFLSARGWICSVPTKSLAAATKISHYTRHFYVPSSWMAAGAGGGGADDTIARVISKNSVALVYRDDLVVFHNFLDFEYKYEF